MQSQRWFGSMAAVIVVVSMITTAASAQVMIESGQLEPPAAGAIAWGAFETSGALDRSDGAVASTPPSPRALALSNPATSDAGAFSSPIFLSGNRQGLSSYARAEALQPDSQHGDSSNAAAVVGYNASAAGVFDLIIRGNAATNSGARSQAQWSAAIYGEGAANLNFEFEPASDRPTCISQTFDGGPVCIFQVNAGSPPLYSYSPIAEASGVFGNTGYSVDRTTNIVPETSTFGGGSASVVLRFSASTAFVVALNASATAGPSNCLDYQLGECDEWDTSEPLGAAFAVVDPVVVPDAVNPDIVVTSTSGPNPNPDDPLVPADVFKWLNSDQVNTLAQIGITPPSTQAAPPATAAMPFPAPSSYGWNNTNVIVTLSATDASGPGVQSINYALSGVLTATGSIPGATGMIPITAEGVTTITYFAQDAAGNKETPKTLIVQIDKTPPALTAVLTPTPNANGWNNTNVTVQFNATDALSGVASVSSPITLSNEGKGQVVTGNATDHAGNTAVLSATVNIDKTPPVISGLPVSGCTLWPPNHQLVNVANMNATDALSGVAPGSFQVTGSSNEAASVTGSGNTSPDILINGGTVLLRAERSGGGTGRVYTLNATATDLAGNVSDVSGSCVVPHDLGGN